MTRALPFAAAAILAVAACSTPAPPGDSAAPAGAEATPAPATVHILVAGPAGPEVQAWVEELTAAIEAGHGNLALVPTPEEATSVVLIEGVEAGAPAGQEPVGEGEAFVMRGSLVIGDDARDFSLAYRGDVRPQAEALARNLPRFAQEAASGGATVEKTEPEPPGSSADTDEGVH